MQQDGQVAAPLSAAPVVTDYDALAFRSVRVRGLKQLGVAAAFVTSDLLAMCAAWTTALLVRFILLEPVIDLGPVLEEPTPFFPDRFLKYTSIVLPSLVLFLIIAAFTGAYRRKIAGTWADFVCTARAAGITTLFVVFATFVGKLSDQFSRLTILLFWIAATVLLPLARVVTRRILARTKMERLRALILATDDPSAEDGLRFATGSRLPFEPCGLVLVGEGSLAPHNGLPVANGLSHLPVLAAETNAEAAIMAVPETCSARIQALAVCQRLFPTVLMTTPLHNVATADVELHTVGSRLILELRHNHIDIVNRAVKRLFDLCFATAVVVLLAPLYALLALLVKLDSEGPVFYSAKRIGKNGVIFDCHKFRTMRVGADDILETILRNDSEAAAEFAAIQKLKNDPRITRFGRFLRKTSLDELPQFFNVLKGDMSVVGPRPIGPEELVRYGDWTENLLAVRPGVTGHWQVSGRSNTTYDERVALDMHYLRNWSLSEDLRIVLKTFRTVVNKTNGAY
jgi:undecaprenyl-phosphate galactose phosphotransferase